MNSLEMKFLVIVHLGEQRQDKISDGYCIILGIYLLSGCLLLLNCVNCIFHKFYNPIQQSLLRTIKANIKDTTRNKRLQIEDQGSSKYICCMLQDTLDLQ